MMNVDGSVTAPRRPQRWFHGLGRLATLAFGACFVTVVLAGPAGPRFVKRPVSEFTWGIGYFELVDRETGMQFVDWYELRTVRQRCDVPFELRRIGSERLPPGGTANRNGDADWGVPVCIEIAD